MSKKHKDKHKEMEEILDSTPTGITKNKHNLPNGLINKAHTKDLFTSVSSTQYIMSDLKKKNYKVPKRQITHSEEMRQASVKE